MPKKRPRIGLLIDFFYDDYQLKIWSGVMKAAKEFDCNLYCFSGGAVDCPQENSVQKNNTYDLVLPSQLDGVIIMSAVIGNYVPFKRFKQFYEPFKALPNVSISMEIKDSPSILIDNKKGMSDMVSHLVEEHDFRRIAFIQGPADNPEAQARYAGYLDGLKMHNISPDPEFVAPGTFFSSSSEKTIELLFDQRKIQCDAVMMSNDWTAIGVLHALLKRGIRVPEDIALTGFDNIRQGRFIKPQLTTVHQPFTTLGREAVTMLVDQLNGKDCPNKRILPTHLRIRNSCGCYQESKYYFSNPVQYKKSKQTADFLSPVNKTLIKKIKHKIEVYFVATTSINILENWINQLVKSLFEALVKSDDQLFLKSVENTVTNVEPENIDIFGWCHILAILFNELLPFLNEQKDIIKLLNLRTKAVEALWKIEHKIEAEYIIKADRLFREISWIGQDLIASVDMGALKQAFLRALPGQGIERFYITEFTRQSNDLRFSRFIEAVERNKSRTDLLEKEEIATASIVPCCFKGTTKNECLIIMPLFVQTEKLGFLIMEYSGLEGPIYENLAIQVSSALKSVKLVEKLSQQAEHLSASNKEKELLIKEVHHRVKNNLQVINSLLNLQSRQYEQKDMAQHFKALQNRIKSMSIIHEHLYKSKDLTKLNLKHYLRELADSLKISHSMDSVVFINVDSEDIYIPLEKAIPLGLVVNELVSNSLKHAFPRKQASESAEISVVCRHLKHKMVYLCVQDNGIGFPQKFNTRETESLGMQIVYTIIEKQLDGTIELIQNPGPCFKMNIPLLG
ncbi:MAG: substrate-binding domain-containing protein [Spirochaetales bacterium]|nr:substrate-binding domain-containing protein [Spirochaetales bacterium]